MDAPLETPASRPGRRTQETVLLALVALTAIVANLPAQWAEALGISQLPLPVAPIAMVGLSLLNYAVKLLPSGAEPTASPQKTSDAGSKALLSAIERGNLKQVRSVLAMGIVPDFVDGKGQTPLMLAAPASAMRKSSPPCSPPAPIRMRRAPKAARRGTSPCATATPTL